MNNLFYLYCLYLKYSFTYKLIIKAFMIKIQLLKKFPLGENGQNTSNAEALIITL